MLSKPFSMGDIVTVWHDMVKHIHDTCLAGLARMVFSLPGYTSYSSVHEVGGSRPTRPLPGRREKMGRVVIKRAIGFMAAQKASIHPTRGPPLVGRTRTLSARVAEVPHGLVSTRHAITADLLRRSGTECSTGLVMGIAGGRN